MASLSQDYNKKETLPIHYFDPITYKVPCGDGDKIFTEGHGGSIYLSGVTCKKCLEIKGHKNEDN